MSLVYYLAIHPFYEHNICNILVVRALQVNCIDPSALLARLLQYSACKLSLCNTVPLLFATLPPPAACKIAFVFAIPPHCSLQHRIPAACKIALIFAIPPHCSSQHRLLAACKIDLVLSTLPSRCLQDRPRLINTAFPLFAISTRLCNTTFPLLARSPLTLQNRPSQYCRVMERSRPSFHLVVSPLAPIPTILQYPLLPVPDRSNAPTPMILQDLLAPVSDLFP